MKMWQLIRKSDGAVIEGPGPLPADWGPIFGMACLPAEELSDLSWLGGVYSKTGDAFDDLSWVEVPDDSNGYDPAVAARSEVRQRLADSDWTMLPDVPMTVGEKQLWIEYRRALRDISSQPGFPDNIDWPVSP